MPLTKKRGIRVFRFKSFCWPSIYGAIGGASDSKGVGIGVLGLIKLSYIFK